MPGDSFWTPSALSDPYWREKWFRHHRLGVQYCLTHGHYLFVYFRGWVCWLLTGCILGMRFVWTLSFKNMLMDCQDSKLGGTSHWNSDLRLLKNHQDYLMATAAICPRRATAIFRGGMCSSVISLQFPTTPEASLTLRGESLVHIVFLAPL